MSVHEAGTLCCADEVDAVLGRRTESEHEAVTGLKMEFLQHWDGFFSESFRQVIVLGATNRPGHLDDAVMRRYASGMPRASAILHACCKLLIQAAHCSCKQGCRQTGEQNDAWHDLGLRV